MVSLVFFLLASMLWAGMNFITFYRNTVRLFPNDFMGPLSWKRKYAQPMEYWPESSRNWYQRLFGIEYTERFPGSATIFVFVTDLYHLLQFFFLWCITISIAAVGFSFGQQPGWSVWCVTSQYFVYFNSYHQIVNVLISALIYRVIWWVGFNVTFTLLKRI